MEPFSKSYKTIFRWEERRSYLWKIINPHCAGIDVGSRTHYVAIGQDLKDVKQFGVYVEDLKGLAEWLKGNKVTSVAM